MEKMYCILHIHKQGSSVCMFQEGQNERLIPDSICILLILKKWQWSGLSSTSSFTSCTTRTQKCSFHNILSEVKNCKSILDFILIFKPYFQTKVHESVRKDTNPQRTTSGGWNCGSRSLSFIKWLLTFFPRSLLSNLYSDRAQCR